MPETPCEVHPPDRVRRFWQTRVLVCDACGYITTDDGPKEAPDA